MKTSERLYQINAELSRDILLKRELGVKEIMELNYSLGEVIKEVRMLEEKVEQ